MGVEDDDATDPAICICPVCLEAARVVALMTRESIVQCMTVVNPKSTEIVVFVVRAGEASLEGRGRTQLEAIEDALRHRMVS